jgi:maltose-binding protein MalE
MDPAADTPAGKLLQARLDQFSRQHDDLSIVVRVKSVSGPGGLLDSLVATNAAAPLALPDLIALPRDGLEAAALKGLLQSVENPESPLDDTGWYEFARELIRVQNSAFGFPICGDALVTVFRPAMVSQPPQNWSEVLELKTPFVFPAADQQAIFTLAQYQSLGIPLRDDEGRPHLEIDQLSQVLTFYGNAEERGVMPFWVTQYQDDQEVWDAYLEKRADIIVAWLTDYLNASPEDSDFSILPVENEQGFTLADGWVWSVASIQTEKREIAIELAKFLSEDRFLAAYADSLGCIAPYKGAVKNQLDPAQRVMIEQIALSARVIPSTDILNSLGLPLQQAVMQVLKNQAEPIPAAQSVIDALTSP